MSSAVTAEGRKAATREDDIMSVLDSVTDGVPHGGPLSPRLIMDAVYAYLELKWAERGDLDEIDDEADLVADLESFVDGLAASVEQVPEGRIRLDPYEASMTPEELQAGFTEVGAWEFLYDMATGAERRVIDAIGVLAEALGLDYLAEWTYDFDLTRYAGPQ